MNSRTFAAWAQNNTNATSIRDPMDPTSMAIQIALDPRVMSKEVLLPPWLVVPSLVL